MMKKKKERWNKKKCYGNGFGGKAAATNKKKV